MKKAEVKIYTRGILLFSLIGFFCLRTHLRSISEKLHSRCIDEITSIGGSCTDINFEGRQVWIEGTVPVQHLIDKLQITLSHIPGLILMKTNFQVPEDSIKIAAIRSLSGHYLYFQKNSTQLLPAGVTFLDSIATVLNQYSDLNLIIQGHTDVEGDSLYNQILSEQRAAAVRTMLIQSGCDSTRIKAVGLGEQMAESFFLVDSLARRVDFMFKENNL